MSEGIHVTLAARVVIKVENVEKAEAERRALVEIRQHYPSLPWFVEHAEIPWGS